MEKWTEQLDKLSEDELLEEAEKIEKELGLSHEIDGEVDEIFYLYEAMKREKKEKQEQTVLEYKKEKKKIAKPRKKIKVKYLFRVGVGVACIFAASMTSQANREKVLWKLEYIFFSEEGTIEYSMDDGRIDFDEMEKVKKNEYMKTEIKRELQVEVPEFWYVPEEFCFDRYEIYKDSCLVIIYYRCKNKYIKLYIYRDINPRVNSTSIDGKILDYGEVKNEKLKIELYSCEDEELNQYYRAEWNYQECEYVLTGKLDRQEFVEILKNIDY